VGAGLSGDCNSEPGEEPGTCCLEPGMLSPTVAQSLITVMGRSNEGS